MYILKHFSADCVLIRTYLKIIDGMSEDTYTSTHAASARRPMGADSGTFSRGASPGKPARSQAGAGPDHLGGRAVDFEYGGAMAHAASVLSQL